MCRAGSSQQAPHLNGRSDCRLASLGTGAPTLPARALGVEVALAILVRVEAVMAVERPPGRFASTPSGNTTPMAFTAPDASNSRSLPCSIPIGDGAPTCAHRAALRRDRTAASRTATLKPENNCESSPSPETEADNHAPFAPFPPLSIPAQARSFTRSPHQIARLTTLPRTLTVEIR